MNLEKRGRKQGGDRVDAFRAAFEPVCSLVLPQHSVARITRTLQWRRNAASNPTELEQAERQACLDRLLERELGGIEF